MFESLAAYTLVEHQFGASFVRPPRHRGLLAGDLAERKPYRTRDGYLCMLAIPIGSGAPSGNWPANPTPPAIRASRP